ncbi:MAG: YdeI family protein [Gemmatimonadales bacterium]
MAATLRSFRTAAAFRAWLQKHHGSRKELMLRCFKVHASHLGVTYKQALEEALCWGWIDGVRRSVDAISFSTRFTPRKRRSVWSRINVALAKALIEAGRMAKPGLVAFEAREAQRIGIYSFERNRARLNPV